MPLSTDLLCKVSPNTGWQLDASGISDASVTSFGLISATGLPTTTAVILTVDRVNSSGVATPTKMERIKGIVSGNSIISCTRGFEGTAQAHSSGAVVEIVISAGLYNRFIDGVLVEHNQDGTHNAPSILSLVYPIGSIYISTVSTNPNTLFGFGTWSAFATGRTLVGIDTGQTEFDVVEETGGEKTHLLTGAESGESGHNHTQVAHAHNFTVYGGAYSNAAAASGLNTGFTNMGSRATDSATAVNNAVAAANASSAHNNLQPYIVTYMWKRVL